MELAALALLIFMSIETDWGRKGGHLFLCEKQTPVFHTKNRQTPTFKKVGVDWKRLA
ncbi:hypothetical protein E2C01_062505 [Portunus trituberculatus]|uniref:Uncharacterized protein n=1 Tax=Portunus trituberculatus TaxID=210409 RepID=A0A5B7HE84_PORTR|nr:hypothetical protein [Portunus trituberculatus]